MTFLRRNHIRTGLIWLAFLAVLNSCGQKSEEVALQFDSAVGVIENLEQVVSPESQKDSLLPPSIIRAEEISTLLLETTFTEGEINKWPVVKLNTDGTPASSQTEAGLGLFTTVKLDADFAIDENIIPIEFYCDRAGNLWFSTNANYFIKYDGKTFENFANERLLEGIRALDFLEDKKGNMWIATRRGALLYDGKSFRSYTTADGLSVDWITAMTEDAEGNIWFGTVGGGVSRFDGKTFTNYGIEDGLMGEIIHDALINSKGELWFSGREGVSKFDGEKFITYTPKDGLAGRDIRTMSTDRKGNMWFGTLNDGLSNFDGKSFTNYTVENGLPGRRITKVFADEEDVVWIGTYGDGLSRFDGQTFTNFTTIQGLPNDLITSLGQDKEGNIWVGTRGGLSKYSGDAFKTYTMDHGLLFNSLWSLAEDKTGTVWIGFYGGAARKEGNSFVKSELFKGMNISALSSDNKGDIWVGTDKGKVYFYDRENVKVYDLAFGNPRNEIYNILPDRNGNIWIGFGSEVAKFDGNTFRIYTPDQGFVAGRVTGLWEDSDGNIWVGAYKGLTRIKDDKLTTFTTEDGLPSLIIQSIIEDKKGNLWIGTPSGLSVLPKSNRDFLNNQNENSSETPKNLFLNYSTEQGLPDNNVIAIREDSKGNIILGTNFGICRINSALSGRMSGGHTSLSTLEGMEVYNRLTGYPVMDVNGGTNNGTLLIDREDVLWIGNGTNGLTRVDFDKIKKNDRIPPLLLRRVRINEEILDWYVLDKYEKDSLVMVQQEIMTYRNILSERTRDSIRQKFSGIKFDSIQSFQQIPVNLVLPYRYNDITFEFVAVETGNNSLVRYQYMLQGLDHDWRPLTDKSFAGFGNLREGSYLFKVKAKSSGGLWTEPLTYSFKVLPPWYRTWWMFAVYGLLAIGFIILIVRWNSRILRERAKKLQAEIRKATRVIRQQKEEVEAEKKKSDDLLLNILPEEVAEELKEKGESQARMFDEVTVLFTDFVNFTHTSEQLSPRQLVEELNACFTAFDLIMEKHGLEKIKTIGDAYLAVSGLPTPHALHAENAVKAALEIRDFMVQRRQNENTFEIRIGLHSGSLVAGIVGIKKFAYDIWGDTVNTAARMEQHGEAGKVNISEVTFELVKDSFAYTYRGKVSAKNKGEIDMYFVEYKE